jgi:hypothetical protein
MKVFALALSLCLTASLCFGQKAKVKKGIVYDDKDPIAQLEKDKKSVKVKSMNGEDLLWFNYHTIRPYERGPVLSYYGVIDPVSKDSFVLDYSTYFSEARLGGLLVDRRLVSDGQLNREALSGLKDNQGEGVVAEFLARNELSLEKVVKRFPGLPTFFDELGGVREFKKDQKYYLAQGDQMNKTVIGYVIIVDHLVSSRQYYKLKFFLPNDLEVASFIYEDLSAQNQSKLFTVKDKHHHSGISGIKINTADILKTVDFLTKRGYL